MGKGDKSTKRGKIFAGSYGNARPQGTKATAGAGETGAARPTAGRTAAKAPAKAPAKAAPRKKA